MSKKKTAKKVVKATKHSSAQSGIRPLGDRVLVAPLPPESVTASGIIIPETIDQEKPFQGRVVAVGPGKRNETGHLWPVDVKVGQKIIFSKYGFDEVKIDGKEYYLIAEGSILAIID